MYTIVESWKYHMAQKFYVELNFYNFTVASSAIKLKSVKNYYLAPNCIDSAKLKIE